VAARFVREEHRMLGRRILPLLAFCRPRLTWRVWARALPWPRFRRQRRSTWNNRQGERSLCVSRGTHRTRVGAKGRNPRSRFTWNAV